MFLLLGLRTAVSLVTTAVFACEVCGVRAAQRVVRRKRRVTLFFIPVLPVGSSWAVECSNCGAVTRLTREQAEHSRRWAADQARSAS